jgi:hypothetical protein
VISGSYTSECVKNDKKRFSSLLASDEITTRRYIVLLFAKCITIMTVEFTVMSGLRSSRD